MKRISWLVVWRWYLDNAAAFWWGLNGALTLSAGIRWWLSDAVLPAWTQGLVAFFAGFNCLVIAAEYWLKQREIDRVTRERDEAVADAQRHAELLRRQNDAVQGLIDAAQKRIDEQCAKGERASLDGEGLG